MIPGRPIVDRAQRIIDLLSERMDDQAMREGADALHCVAVYGAFQRAAGNLERALANRLVLKANVFAWTRALRKIQASHRAMVRMHGTYVRAERTKRAQAAIKAAKRGKS